MYSIQKWDLRHEIKAVNSKVSGGGGDVTVCGLQESLHGVTYLSQHFRKALALLPSVSMQIFSMVLSGLFRITLEKIKSNKSV